MSRWDIILGKVSELLNSSPNATSLSCFLAYIWNNIFVPRIWLDQFAEPVARCRVSVFGASVNGGFYDLSGINPKQITNVMYFEDELLPQDEALPSVPALSKCFYHQKVKPSSLGPSLVYKGVKKDKNKYLSHSAAAVPALDTLKMMNRHHIVRAGEQMGLTANNLLRPKVTRIRCRSHLACVLQ